MRAAAIQQRQVRSEQVGTATEPELDKDLPNLQSKHSVPPLLASARPSHLQPRPKLVNQSPDLKTAFGSPLSYQGVNSTHGEGRF